MRVLLVALAFLIGACGDGDADVESDQRDRCKSQCSVFNSGGRSACITGTTTADCGNVCLTETPNTVESFNSCVDTNRWSGGIFTNDGSNQTCPERQCLDILNVEYEGEQ